MGSFEKMPGKALAATLASVLALGAGGEGTAIANDLSPYDVGADAARVSSPLEVDASSPDPQAEYACEVQALNAFGGGREYVVRNRRGLINNRAIGETAIMRDARTATTFDDGRVVNCASYVTVVLRAGELIQRKGDGTGMNTPVDQTGKPKVLYGGLGPATINKRLPRRFAPKRRDRIRQYVEIDVSPLSDPSKVYGKVYKSPPVRTP